LRWPRAEAKLAANQSPEVSVKKSILLLLSATLAMALVTGCNTVKGFGKDVKKVGEQIDEKASK